MQKLSQVVVAHDSSGERTLANAHGSDGCLERQTTTRTTPSWRTCQADHRCCSSKMDFRWCVSKGCMSTFFNSSWQDGRFGWHAEECAACIRQTHQRWQNLAQDSSSNGISKWMERSFCCAGWPRVQRAQDCCSSGGPGSWPETSLALFDFCLDFEKQSSAFLRDSPLRVNPPCFFTFRGSQAPNSCIQHFAEPMVAPTFFICLCAALLLVNWRRQFGQFLLWMGLRKWCFRTLCVLKALSFKNGPAPHKHFWDLAVVIENFRW